MNRIVHLAIFLGLAATCEAQGVGRIAEVTIVDRDSGATLSAHFYHGDYWVAGRPGGRYAVQIRNRLGERVLAVTSVDGVNVISGDTAGWDQTGYVFDPGQAYEITGWRKSDSEVAAFTFTDSPNSYAERTGRPANVGVIGVAVFRERPSPPVESPPMIGGLTRQQEASRAAEADSAGRSKSSGNAAAATAPTSSAVLAAPTVKLGTGHGEREYSHVNHTEFLRMQTQPNELIRIHYDSLDNLFAMGIVKRPRPAGPTSNPFPASPGQSYVPDPQG